jgi:hypothetical protein
VNVRATPFRDHLRENLTNRETVKTATAGSKRTLREPEAVAIPGLYLLRDWTS